MKKILVCFGTRPEAIKMAPLCRALLSDGSFAVQVCVTAQHRQMLDQVLDFFEIVPDFDLDCMQAGQTLNDLSARILQGMEQVLTQSEPDLVLVHGDTTTSTMVAMAAFHKNIPVGHIEAGLRTYNLTSPFPEEANRQLTGRLARFHFAPTPWAAENLRSEKVAETQIVVTGNTVIDALHLGLQKIASGYESADLNTVKTLFQSHVKTILVTGHRRENFGTGFEQLCQAMAQIAQEAGVQIIYPVHLNPQVQEPVYRILGNKSNIHLIAPLDYPAFIYAMNQATLIITDSGGVQEEAPSLGKPVLVTRNTTERPEAVTAGTVKLVGTDTQTLVDETRKLLHNEAYYKQMSEAHNPYGNGKACAEIINFLKNNW